MDTGCSDYAEYLRADEEPFEYPEETEIVIEYTDGREERRRIELPDGFESEEEVFDYLDRRYETEETDCVRAPELEEMYL